MKILIGVDGSHASDFAITWYIRNHRDDNHVILGHVIEMPIQPGYYRGGLTVPPERLRSMLDEAEANYKTIEHKYRQLLTSHGVSHEVVRREGQPGQTLCHLAKEKEVGLVIMGTRGLGKMRRTLLGSISDYVLHHAHVPVSICHLPKPEIPPHEHQQSNYEHVIE